MCVLHAYALARLRQQIEISECINGSTLFSSLAIANNSDFTEELAS